MFCKLVHDVQSPVSSDDCQLPSYACYRRDRASSRLCSWYILLILASIALVAWWSQWIAYVLQSVVLFLADTAGLASFAAHLSSCGKAPSLLPSYPLAVKSPYLSTWVPGRQLRDAATAQPQFWTGTNLTWPILARVDGVAYALFGMPGELIDGLQTAKTDSIRYTSLHTYIDVSAGGVDFMLDYFTPVYPKKSDYLVHSLPYSYLTISASTKGCITRDVQIFSAIDQTWTAQDGAVGVKFTTFENIGYFQFYNPNEVPFTESNEMATWGSIVFGTMSSSEITAACGDHDLLYSSFARTGTLCNSTSACSPSDLTGIATNFFGDLGNTGANITFAVGLDRPKAVNYLGAAQTGYYRTKWPTIPKALQFVLGNYDNALTDSVELDALIRSNTQSVSSDFGNYYADICEASFRQAIAPVELTVPMDNLEALPSAFLKEISSNGNMNTVDLVFQSWPIYIHLNPEWWILQLKPTLEYLAAGRWPHPWVIHDLGLHYPNATGHDNGLAEQMPLFETSTMFILFLAYQMFTNDTSYTDQYQHLFSSWADYLVEESLYPKTQLISVDAIAGSPNQTALAIQSAIGLKAAARLTGNITYAEKAAEFAHIIYNDALGLDGNTLAQSTHFTYNYGNEDSWNVIFAAYSDVILSMNTFPQSAWDMQSSWYSSKMDTAGLAWAGPVSDKGVDWAITDWNIMAAAVSPDLQKSVVKTTWDFMTNGKNDVPFGTKYLVGGEDAGKWIANTARSTVGTHFAISALQQGVWSY